jgi:hypothetical protein
MGSNLSRALPHVCHYGEVQRYAKSYTPSPQLCLGAEIDRSFAVEEKFNAAQRVLTNLLAVVCGDGTDRQQSTGAGALSDLDSLRHRTK